MLLSLSDTILEYYSFRVPHFVFYKDKVTSVCSSLHCVASRLLFFIAYILPPLRIQCPRRLWLFTACSEKHSHSSRVSNLSLPTFFFYKYSVSDVPSCPRRVLSRILSLLVHALLNSPLFPTNPVSLAPVTVHIVFWTVFPRLMLLWTLPTFVNLTSSCSLIPIPTFIFHKSSVPDVCSCSCCSK